ncbi:MAG TPA: plastocyanin/azurin family copper-binding protein [Gemmatimonadaceae bacterium]|jgi:plastocyanin|nr:plastocyanin/azurin family copper-binding protein [Gemmatimonadaceae bacterium]
MSRKACTFSYLLATVAILAACKGDQKAPVDTAKQPATSGAANPDWGAGPLNPDPGGKVIPVELYTDGAGNYYKPAEVHAKRGDVIRFTLKVGVHNVHFLADSNAGKNGYPQTPSDFLQLPGQTWDLAVKQAAGSYYFQCDPHAALGMKGHLVVE